MLNGQRCYAAFPDENPEIKLRMRGLLDTLVKLENEFRGQIEQFPRGNTAPREERRIIGLGFAPGELIGSFDRQLNCSAHDLSDPTGRLCRPGCFLQASAYWPQCKDWLGL
jgi:hypothetical protein